MALPWTLLLLRTLAIGVERVLLKEAGRGGRTPGATFWFFAFAFLALTPFGLAHPLPPGARLSAAASGLVFAAAFAAFIRALAEGEVSRLTPLSGLSHVFLFAMAVVIGSERPGAPQILGVLLILAGTARLSGGSLLALRGLGRERGARLMVLYTLLLAVERLLDQRGGRLADPLAYAWTMFGSVTVVLALWLLVTGNWRHASRLATERWPVLLGAAFTNVVTYGSLVALLDSFPLTVMEPATSLSYLVTAWLGRKFYGEDLTGRIWPVVVIAAGSGLVLFR